MPGNYSIHFAVGGGRQKLSLRLYLEINPSWGFPNTESHISIGKYVRIRFNFQPMYLHLQGKLEEEVWIQTGTVVQEIRCRASGNIWSFFWSPLNLKALTKTSRVLPNTSWHGLRKKKKKNTEFEREQIFFHHSKMHSWGCATLPTWWACFQT